MATTSGFERAQDPRPARTRAAIVDAFRDLAAATPGQTPTMQAIAAAAGVSRTSLYKQFPDLTSISVHLLNETFTGLGDQDVRRRQDPAIPPADSARMAVRGLVDYFRSHYELYRASLDWEVTSRVHEMLVASYAQRIVNSSALIGHAPVGEELHDQAHYIAGGVIALITKWMRDGDQALTNPDQADQTTARLLGLMPCWLVSNP